MDFQKELFSILASFNGAVGIYYYHWGKKKEFSINAGLSFSAASVIKIPLVAYALKLVKEGKLSLEQKIEIQEKNIVGGTGILRHLNREYKPTLKELCKLAIIVSDNIATNVLIDLVGGCDNVGSFCQQLGFGGLRLQRKMLDLASLKAGRDNFITAGEIGRFLIQLENGHVVSGEADKMLIDFMKAQQLRNKLPYLLPAVESYDDQIFLEDVPKGKVVIANKTGDLWTTQNDVGIFYLPEKQKYVLSVCTSELQKQSDGIGVIGLISDVFYRYSDSLS